MAGQGGAGGVMEPDPTIDLGIISQSDASLREAESTVSAASDDRVLVAWIGLEPGGGSHIGYAFSTDRGTTFGPLQRLDAPGGRPSADPVAAADSAGTIYLAWLAFAADTTDTDHIYVVRADPGSTTFGPPVEATDPVDPAFYDKPHLSITSSDTVLVSYTRQVSLVAARSSDGRSFTHSVIANETPIRNHIVATCSSGSRVWATHLRYADITQDRHVYLRWSDDDGLTWPPSQATQVTLAEESDAALDDPHCVADGDDVWIAYGRTHATPSASGFGTLHTMRIAHSSDGGQSITARYDVQDPSAGAAFLHPRLTRDAAQGLEIVYYAGAREGDPAASVLWSRSPAGEPAFAPASVVHHPVALIQARNDPRWIGEYFGTAWADGNLYVAYVDNAGAASHVGFFRTSTP